MSMPRPSNDLKSPDAQDAGEAEGVTAGCRRQFADCRIRRIHGTAGGSGIGRAISASPCRKQCLSVLKADPTEACDGLKPRFVMSSRILIEGTGGGRADNSADGQRLPAQVGPKWAGQK